MRDQKGIMLYKDRQFTGGDLTAWIKEQKEVKHARIAEIFDKLKGGWNANQIIRFYSSEENGRYSKHIIRKDIGLAYKMLDAYVMKEIGLVTGIHLQRYEDIYGEAENDIELFLEKAQEDPEIAKVINKIVPMKIDEALKALYAKEDLFGIHDKFSDIEVTNDNLKKKKEDQEYDLKSMSMLELIELRNLLNGARMEEEEGIQKVLIKQSSIETNNLSLHEDVNESEIEMPDSSIARVKLEVDEKENKHRIDQLKRDHGKVIDDVQKSLTENHTKQFLELIKRKKQ